jgi:DNA-directed RNA polymerase subunit RPC12/RpoP
MAELRSIRGNKPKAMAAARILECPPPCGSRTLIEVRCGVAVDKYGKVIHRGTLMRKCAHCGKFVD